MSAWSSSCASGTIWTCCKPAAAAWARSPGDGFGIIRFTDDACLLLVVNRGDAPLTFTVAPDLFPEGPDGETRMPLDGTFTDETGGSAGPILGCTETVPPRAAMDSA